MHPHPRPSRHRLPTASSSVSAPTVTFALPGLARARSPAFRHCTAPLPSRSLAPPLRLFLLSHSASHRRLLRRGPWRSGRVCALLPTLARVIPSLSRHTPTAHPPSFIFVFTFTFVSLRDGLGASERGESDGEGREGRWGAGLERCGGQGAGEGDGTERWGWDGAGWWCRRGGWSKEWRKECGEAATLGGEDDADGDADADVDGEEGRSVTPTPATNLGSGAANPAARAGAGAGVHDAPP
ncbi:hypothetical protein C8J57DRAFT_1311322 [Mycena rebaudengoi]|nr:hypothetical protein C8J57DRAFT_1311322 [Mycena rebaudengoi]